jgi:UDP-N-acetylmuramate--alanine ligase
MDGPWSGRKLHFVGIGGAGMSGLALVARELGAEVTGSDRSGDSSYVARLRAAGIEPVVGHDAANVPAGAEVVYSTAVGPDNPERAAAERELHRADLLGELTRLRPTIAVSGTHGKTTTSSMLVHALRGAGADPGYLVGGEVRSTGSNAGWGTGEWLVVEADESDRSLLKLARQVAVLTNAELDHHATYASRRDVEATFREFLGAAEHAVVWDRPELLALADGSEAGPAGGAPASASGGGSASASGGGSASASGGGPRVWPFDAAPTLSPGGSRFTLAGVEVQLAVPGAHNALNAAAALTAVRAIGGDVAAAAAALRDFSGAGRRFERVGTTPAGALVVDDYAHHPTEVRATLEAARTLSPRRVVAVFQPHLFSRTKHQAREFGAALALADLPVVTAIYPARERAEDHPGVSGRLVAEAAADAAGGRRVAWLPDLDAAERFLRAELREGDLLLTLGAGDIDGLGRRLAAPGRTPGV